MTTYTDTKLYSRMGMAGDYLEVSQCDTCGVLVLDQTTHDEFHERVDNIGKTARAADNTAQLFRPLGGYQRPISPPLEFDRDDDRPA